MYINITDSETADNKGSSGGLVHYLDKENRTDVTKQPEYWFNQKRDNILSDEVRPALDNNIAKLSKPDAKFFLVNSESINSNDTSISKSTQLDYTVPASKISGLSSGAFVGIVADKPDDKIELKVFHSEIQNNHAAVKAEEEQFIAIPEIDKVTTLDIQENYKMIKSDIENLIEKEIGILKARKAAENPPEPISESEKVKPRESEASTGPAISM